MPSHGIPDAEFTDLLMLILQEAGGAAVARQISLHSSRRIHRARQLSFLAGYLEPTGFTTDPASPYGMSFDGVRLTDRGRAKLAELEHAHRTAMEQLCAIRYGNSN